MPGWQYFFLPFSAILFSVCIFVFNMELMPIYAIVPVATLGAHLGDMSGFFFGKTVGPSLLSSKFMTKREKLIKRAQSFLDKTGSYTVLLGRFIPAIRPIVPFLLGISDLKAVRFYLADVFACCCWGIALGFLVTGVGSNSTCKSKKAGKIVANPQRPVDYLSRNSNDRCNFLYCV